MEDVLVTIDARGRIILPSGIRKRLSIKRGDKLKLSSFGTSITLTPSNAPAGFIRKGKALVFSGTGGKKLTNETVNKI
jgi:AbrB family looped-hinge helix DNA binding protein